jgi:hypothetical protein
MVFVYLRDGRRQDIEDAVTFARRGESLLCLDVDGDEVARFRTSEVIAFGHAAYQYDPAFLSRPLETEEARPAGGRRRRRHSSARLRDRH